MFLEFFFCFNRYLDLKNDQKVLRKFSKKLNKIKTFIKKDLFFFLYFHVSILFLMDIIALIFFHKQTSIYLFYKNKQKVQLTIVIIIAEFRLTNQFLVSLNN